MATEAAVFDVMGTLFSLERPRQALLSVGAPAASLEAWFERVLHQAACLSILGDFHPFSELAAGALRTTLAQLGLDPARSEPLDALRELDAYEDAAEALALLRDAGLEVAVLTNGGAEDTEHLLERSGLASYVQQIVTVEEAGRYKPDRAPYEQLLQRLRRGPEGVAFVAAHAWDCLGASSVGLRAVWIDRLEHEWPFQQAEQPRAGSLLEAARLLLHDGGAVPE